MDVMGEPGVAISREIAKGERAETGVGAISDEGEG